MASSNGWEEMRRKARQLEDEIDSKLVALNKINCASSSGSVSYSDADKMGTKRVSSKRALFDSLSGEIESYVSKLTKFNNEMKDFVERDKSESEHNKSALYHIVRRHREILRDYTTEFNRTSQNIKNQLEREDLLSGGDFGEEPETSALNNRAKSSDYLLRENDRINSCDRLLNDQISIAMSVKENLHGQKSGLGDINKRILQLTKKYPAINSLMQKIRFKKRKDTVILAIVITTCLILSFIYLMR